MKKPLLLIAIAFAMVFYLDSCVEENDPVKHTIAVLLPVESSNPIDGIALKAAAEVAVSVLNESTENNFELKVFDTGYSIDLISAAIDSIVSNDIDVVVSALTSSNLSVLADKINDSGILMIDVTSTLSDLAVDDNIIRFVPDDKTTAKAINNALQESNCTQLALAYRNDVWGSALTNELKSLYEATGGAVIVSEEYDARLPFFDIPDNVAKLNDAVSLALDDPESGTVAVELFSFEEAIDVFVEAAQYPSLQEVQWFGSDGFVNNAELFENEEAAAFAEKVGVFCPVIGKLENTEYVAVLNQTKEKINYEPYAVAGLMYDAVLAAGKVTVGLIASDNLGAKDILLNSLQDIEFITGDLELNANGDRVSCTYDFWGVRKENGSYEWYKAF